MKLRALVFCFLLPSLSLADALPPPSTPAAQIAAAPNHRPLVYTNSRGTLNMVGENATFTPNPHYKTVSPGPGGTLTGTKTHPVRLSNNYGQVATGQIRTATTMPSNDILSKAGAGLITANIVGNGLQKAAPSAGASIAQGKYVDAGATIAAEIAIAADITGLGHGINDLINTIRKHTADKAAVAQQAYDQSKTLDLPPSATGYYAVPVIIWSMHDGKSFSNKTYYAAVPQGQVTFSKTSGALSRGESGSFDIYVNGTLARTFIVPTRSDSGTSWRVDSPVNLTQQFYDSNSALFLGSHRHVTMTDLVMTQEEIAALLQTMLEDNRRNQTDLINALWQMGVIGPANTQTTVSGTPAENTFVTPPFTPAGSDTAQQTQFVVNRDGSVTVSTVNRPDLAAHTSQAPTRAEVGQTATAPDTVPAKPSATAEAPDVCANNPNSLMCADMGSGDYTDPVIPTKSIPLDFRPADIFSTDGVCPAPVAIDVMGVTKQWHWEPTCDGARKIRPIAIASVVIMCGLIVFGAIREL